MSKRKNTLTTTKLYPSKEMAAVIGKKPISHTNANKAIWKYIKKHHLQDPNNKRMINADKNLAKLFNGKEQVSMFEMSKIVSKNVSTTQPILNVAPNLNTNNKPVKSHKVINILIPVLGGVVLAAGIAAYGIVSSRSNTPTVTDKFTVTLLGGDGEFSGPGVTNPNRIDISNVSKDKSLSDLLTNITIKAKDGGYEYDNKWTTNGTDEVDPQTKINKDLIIYPKFKLQEYAPALTEDFPSATTIRAIEDSTLTIKEGSGGAASGTSNISYSFTGETESWTTLNGGQEKTVNLPKGSNLYLIGDNPDGFNSDASGNIKGWKISISGKCNIGGSVMGLLDEGAKTILNIPTGDEWKYCFGQLFSYSTGINKVNENFLPSTTLTQSCYKEMFEGCTSLKNMPNLPAATLANGCYASMFQGCKSLQETQILPATILDVQCYMSMFKGCTNLKTVGEIKAEVVASQACSSMFSNCISLVNAPTLKATKHWENNKTEELEGVYGTCYNSMFINCKSLKNVPDLPATILISSCYMDMFDGCISLTTTPVIKATTVGLQCCKQMFKNCTGLTSVKKLLATTLADNCYEEMFIGCTSLKIDEGSANLNGEKVQFFTCPDLTGLTDAVKDMFTGCKSTGFTGTPTANGVYSYDVYGTKMVADISEMTKDNYKIGEKWDYTGFKAVATLVDGTTKNITNADCTFDLEENSYVNAEFDSGETEKEIIITAHYGDATATFTRKVTSVIAPLQFESTTSQSFTLSFSQKKWGRTEEGECKLEYSTTNNDNDWHEITSISGAASSNEGKLWLRGSGIQHFAAGVSSDKVTNFVFTSSDTEDFGIACDGDIRSLLNYEDVKDAKMDDYCFSGLFDLPNLQLKTHLKIAPALPATTLTVSCYESMFYGCSKLETAPALPATTLADSCYKSMFQKCINLTAAPELPAKNLAPTCYAYMFQTCTALETAPALPATDLTNGCYWCMFALCENLETAPALPATTLPDNCYNGMFSGCKGLWIQKDGTEPAIGGKIFTCPTTFGTNAVSQMFSGCNDGAFGENPVGGSTYYWYKNS